MDKKLSFIHLSDLHISTKDKFDRATVIDALWKDIKKYRDAGINPDFIAFSGDITHGGLTEEYDLASTEFFDPLLEVTALTKDRLFIVPGNHDCNWSITTKLKDPLPNISTEKDIQELLEDVDARATYLLPLANYNHWKESYLGSFQSITPSHFSESYTVKNGNLVVRVIGLNSELPHEKVVLFRIGF